MKHETFDIEVGGGYVHGDLYRPDGDGPVPVVLCAWDLAALSEPSPTLMEAMAEQLPALGIACVQFGPRQEDPAAGATAEAWVDDAAAVFRWILLQEDLDPGRLGGFGAGAGAIVTGCLAGRTDDLNRVCLFSPLSPATLVNRVGGPDEPTEDSHGTEFFASLDKLDPIGGVAKYDRPTLILTPASDERAARCATDYAGAIERAAHTVRHEVIARAEPTLGDESLRDVAMARITEFFSSMPVPAGAK